MVEPFRHSRRVRYVEVDAQSVVYNAHYLTWFDEAITELMREIGEPVLPPEGLAFDFHTVRGLVEYKKPIRFDERVIVTVNPVRVGNSSLCFELTVQDEENVMCATGEVVWVYTNQLTGKSAPIPDSVRSAFQ